MIKVRAVLRRRWPILVVTALLGVLAGLVSSFLGPDGQTTRYQAEQVLVANPVSGNPASVAQDALKVTRGEVPQVAAELLDEPERRTELTRKVDVTPDEDSASITLRAVDDEPEFASDVVQAFSAAFLQVVNAELRSDDTRQLEQLGALVDEAAAELEGFDEANASVLRPDLPVQQTPALDALLAERRRLAEAVSTAEQRLITFQLEATQREPYTTLGPEMPRLADAQLLAIPNSPLFRAGLLGLVGLLLGAALVAAIERINRRVDTRDELTELINVPILAEIGHVPAKRRPVDEHGRVRLDGMWSEQYRRVRAAIQFVQAEAAARAAQGGRTVDPLDAHGTTAHHPGAVISSHNSGRIPKVFLFASALPSEGKSTSTSLSAIALAESGEETVVINADFRRPTIEKYLGVGISPSIADLADPLQRLSIDEVVQPTGMDHLWIAAAGPPTLDVKARLQATRELASEAANRGATVLIDSSPLRITNDPIDLMSVVDEVILVVRAGEATVKSLEDTFQTLDMHHAPVLGVIFVGTMASRETSAYYDSYFDAEAAAAAVAAERRPAPPALPPAPVAVAAAAPSQNPPPPRWSSDEPGTAGPTPAMMASRPEPVSYGGIPGGFDPPIPPRGPTADSGPRTLPGVGAGFERQSPVDRSGADRGGIGPSGGFSAPLPPHDANPGGHPTPWMAPPPAQTFPPPPAQTFPPPQPQAFAPPPAQTFPPPPAPPLPTPPAPPAFPSGNGSSSWATGPQPAHGADVPEGAPVSQSSPPPPVPPPYRNGVAKPGAPVAQGPFAPGPFAPPADQRATSESAEANPMENRR
jgi:Mrp family chromosome partitioning ATPase